MKIVIAGGSGFLGDALRQRLQADGATVAVLTRRPRPGEQNDVPWTPDGTVGDWARALDGIDAVVNLAGAGIADRRWSDERKALLRSSRILATRSLVAAIQQAAQPPRMFLSGSGIGYYGPHGEAPVTEATPAGSDFLARLCVEWEREAEQASSVTRVTTIRTGLVLHPEGGALARMLLPFKLGGGGPIGSGRQYLPWIHRDDWVDLARWLTTEPAARGAFNASAPAPVTNRTFARTLGRVLRRPAIVPMPAFALRILVGELADALLTGQNALPARAEEMGFRFRFPKLEAALRDLLR